MINFQPQQIDKCKYVVVPPRGDYIPPITPDSTPPFAPSSSSFRPPLFLPEVVTYFWLQGGDILVVIDTFFLRFRCRFRAANLSNASHQIAD